MAPNITKAAHWSDDELVLQLYVQPKSSRDQWIGLHGDALKICITAPPVDGKANAHLTKFLAKSFRVAKGQIRMIRGEQGRQKCVGVSSPKQYPELIKQYLTETNQLSS